MHKRVIVVFGNDDDDEIRLVVVNDSPWLASFVRDALSIRRPFAERKRPVLTCKEGKNGATDTVFVSMTPGRGDSFCGIGLIDGGAMIRGAHSWRLLLTT